MPRPLSNAWALAPLYSGEVLAALALWYMTSERPRLRSRVIVNGLALVFISRLLRRYRRRGEWHHGQYWAGGVTEI